MTARDELLGLVERDGFITPASVLEAATDPTNVLHGHFTWDDTEAAQKYRLVEAGMLIRRYKITVEGGDDALVRVRQFTSVQMDDGRYGYLRTDAALSNPETHDLVLKQAIREVAVLRRKYQALVDFDAVLATSIRHDAEEEQAS